MTPYIHQPDDPIYGVAGELDGETLKLLIERQISPMLSERKRIAWLAYDVFRNRLARHILDEIRFQQNSRTIADDMAKLLSGVRNDAVDVTAQVAVCWKNGAERHFGGDGDESDTTRTEQEQALFDLAEESAFSVIANEVNQLAWLQGPQFAVPVIRGVDPRLTVDVLGPHVYDVVQDITDPLGAPVGLAWHLARHRYGDSSFEHHVHVLDGVSLRRFVIRGQERTEVSRVEHGYGRLPAACLRFTRPMAADDWYLADNQLRLVQGVIEIGVKLARMGLVRKAQCHNLLVVIGDLAKFAKGQEKSDPEAGLTFDVPRGGGSVDVKVIDYDIDPKHFISEILFWVQCMVEPYGGHVGVDPGQPDLFGRVVIPPSVQAEHRKRQIPAALEFEKAFWASAVAMMRAEGHRLASTMPDPTDVRRNLRVNFGHLSRDLEDPEKAAKHEDWQLSRGQSSEVDIMRRRLGGVSEDEAWREVERNMKNRSKFADLAARFNLSTSPDGSTQTLPQANGAMGTPAREALRAATQAVAGNGATPEGATAPTPQP